MSRAQDEAPRRADGVSRRGFLRAAGATAAGAVAASGALEASSSQHPEPAQVHLEAGRVRPGAQIQVHVPPGQRAPGRLLPVQVCPQTGAPSPLPVPALRPRGHQTLFLTAPPNPSPGEVYLLALAWQPQAGGRLRLSNTVEVVCTPFYVGM
jgi:hypothetical protein